MALKKKKPAAKAGKSKLDLIKEQRNRLKSGKGGSLLFIKADEVLRLRNVSTGEHSLPGLDITQFYLGAELKGVLSPHSIGLPCALMEYYNECKDSGDEDLEEVASSMSIRQRVVMPVYKYNDENGKAVDTNGVKMLLITPRLYEDWLEWYSDPEKGDASDPVEGYDIKWSREGKGKLDTKYKMIDCKPTKAHKDFRKEVKLEELVAGILPSYEETKNILAKFLGTAGEEPEGDALSERPKKKKGLKKKKK